MKYNKTLIAAIMLSAVAAVGAAYLLLSDDGAELREGLGKQFSKAKDFVFGGRAEEQEPAAQPDYLQHKPKAPKTDRGALLRGELLHDQSHE